MVVRRALGMSSLAKAEDRSLLRDSKAATADAQSIVHIYSDILLFWYVNNVTLQLI